MFKKREKEPAPVHGIAIRESGKDKVFNIVNLTLVTIILLVTLYPLLFAIFASFTDPQRVASGDMLLFPLSKDWIMWDGYKTVIQNSRVWLGYRNTIFYTVVATLLNLAVTLPAAYALSRKDFVGRNFFTTMFLVTMFFQGGLIPTYLLMTQTLHINNTIWVMIIPGATTMNNIIITRTFFVNTIPDSMREAAEIDGCSNFRLFFSIVLPLSGAIIAVMALYFGVSHWNSYFNAMIYLDEQGNLVPLQIILRQILVKSEYDAQMLLVGGTTADELGNSLKNAELVKYALIIISSIPVLIFYPFIQKYFVKGVMVGAVKG